ARQQQRDAVLTLVPALDQVRRALPFDPRRATRPMIVAAGLALALGAVMLLPAPAEPLRAEQAALQAAVLGQAAALDKARREAVVRGWGAGAGCGRQAGAGGGRGGRAANAHDGPRREPRGAPRPPPAPGAPVRPRRPRRPGALPPSEKLETAPLRSAALF